MTLLSPTFYLFVTAAIGVYYICPTKLQWMWLLTISGVFYYMAGGVAALLATLVMILLVWLAALLLHRMPKYRKGIMIGGLACVLAMLFSYRYLGFLETTMYWVQRFLGLEQQTLFVKLAAPLGISFYTFQLLGYLIDVYWKSYSPQKNPLKFCLYGLYFPYILSGPINRYAQLSPQLFSPHRFEYNQCCFGIQRILWGVFKKLVIAERLATVVGILFSNHGIYRGPYVWLGAACFGLQLYADFSGAMDIVIGISQCFGIKLPENFQTPFFSKNLSEFWRRWHITLGAWFRDYLLYPFLKTERIISWGRHLKQRFGKKWAKRIPTYLGLLLVWLSVGFWHGGAYQYIWGSGLLMWCMIVAGELCAPLLQKLTQALSIRTTSLGYHIFCSLRTFAIMCVSYIFFRATSFMDAVHMLLDSLRRPIAHLSMATLIDVYFGKMDILVLAVSLGIVLWVDILHARVQENGGSVRVKIAQKPWYIRWILYEALIIMILVWGYYGVDHPISQFIYQNF